MPHEGSFSCASQSKKTQSKLLDAGGLQRQQMTILTVNLALAHRNVAALTPPPQFGDIMNVCHYVQFLQVRKGREQIARHGAEHHIHQTSTPTTGATGYHMPE